jgi:hypothetical protein
MRLSRHFQMGFLYRGDRHVIAAWSRTATGVAKQATNTIPIVGISMGSGRSSGLIVMFTPLTEPVYAGAGQAR